MHRWFGIPFRPGHIRPPGRLSAPARQLCAFLLLFSLGLACQREEPPLPVDQSKTVAANVARRAPPPKSLRFGFDPRLDPIEEAAIYNPFLSYLEKATGIPFELRFTKRNENIVHNLGSGVVQFAAIGSVSSVKARKLHGATTLVRGLNADGQANYRSAIVTRPGSGIATVSALRGRSFAFGDVDSTQGHLIPRMMLLDAGVPLDALARNGFTGSHQNCAEAVISGAFDAGGLQDTLAMDFEARGQLTIVAFSEPWPSSGISVAPGVAPEVVAAVSRALLAFDPAGRDREALYHWQRTEMPRGFKAAEESDYAIVKSAMRRQGLLPTGKGGP